MNITISTFFQSTEQTCKLFILNNIGIYSRILSRNIFSLSQIKSIFIIQNLQNTKKYNKVEAKRWSNIKPHPQPPLHYPANFSAPPEVSNRIKAV